MKEIEVVVDVRQSPDNAELIVVKQKLFADGDLRLGEKASETRLPLRSLAGLKWDERKLAVKQSAQIALETLSEAERHMVLEAAGSLSGTDPAQWPTDRVVRLAGDRPTYLLRVSPEWRAFIAPAGHGGIELLDIVHEETLERFREQKNGAGVQE